MESEHEGDSRDLKIMLLGISGAGKSSIGNAILGREAFKESRTRESEIQTRRVEDRNISIVDTPGFFNTHLTDEELQKQMLKSLTLAHPGPHMFLLVIDLETFREEQRNIMEKIEEIFGAQAFKFTMVLITGREKMPNREWMLFILDTKFQQLVSHCKDNYHAINSKNKINHTHITELLQKIDETVKQNNHQHYNNEICLTYRTRSIRMKKNQEEENSYTNKKTGIKQQQTKSASKTFTAHSVMEDRTTHTVTEEESESIRENTKYEENTHRETEKEERQERAKIKESFEMESTTEKRTTHIVTRTKKENVVSYVRQTRKTTHIYENLNEYSSLDRFEEFSNERMGSKNIVKTLEKSWGMSSKTKYNILSEDDLRIVLVGKTGVGKSATGNTILGKKMFHEEQSFESVTKKCKKHKNVVGCRNISVIDTPGLCDTSTDEWKLKEEIVKCVNKSVPGPHVFLLVIRLDMRFTDEEKNTVRWIQKNFGKDAERYTIILFTREDQMKKPIDKCLTKNQQMRELVSQCGGRYHAFDNTKEVPAQVDELLKKIDTMVIKNGGQHYTNEMYEKAQKKIMMKKVEDAALVGASVAGVGAAVAGGAVLVAATGGVALPVALMAGGAALAGGPGVKVMADKVKHFIGKRRSSIHQDLDFYENEEGNE